MAWCIYLYDITRDIEFGDRVGQRGDVARCQPGVANRLLRRYKGSRRIRGNPRAGCIPLRAQAGVAQKSRRPGIEKGTLAAADTSGVCRSVARGSRVKHVDEMRPRIDAGLAHVGVEANRVVAAMEKTCLRSS